MAKKRAAGKRDLVKTPGNARFTKRTAKGAFKEMDDVGRSLKADRTRKAKKVAKSGFGDSGDRIGAKKR
jgi:hypothetical protein